MERQAASEGAPGEWAGREMQLMGGRSGKFREPSGGSVRDSEQKPRGGRITVLPGRIGAAAALEARRERMGMGRAP